MSQKSSLPPPTPTSPSTSPPSELDLESGTKSKISDVWKDPHYDNGQMFIPISTSTRNKLRTIVKSLWMKMALLVLVLFDFIIFCVQVSRNLSSSEYRITNALTLTILFLLLFECFLRLLAFDFIGFFTWWNMFDLVITLVSIFCQIFVQYGHFVVFIRLLRISRVVWLMYRNQRGLKKAARQLVSSNRRRFDQEGYDLDITYITDRILAMSVPATKVESMYRNPVEDVAKFFNAKHPGNYKIYNLCPERKYPYEPFKGEIKEYFMGDHNPAPLAQLLDFCQDAYAWLKEDPQHVFAVHCKGGKGRTGTMICSYLLYSGLLPSADEAMEYFANRRTSEAGKREGIEAKSQERYLRYFQVVTSVGRLPKSVPLILKYIRVHGITTIHVDPTSLWFIVYEGFGDEIYNQQNEIDKVHLITVDVKNNYADFFPAAGEDLVIKGDTRICFHKPKVQKGTLKKLKTLTSTSGLSKKEKSPLPDDDDVPSELDVKEEQKESVDKKKMKDRQKPLFYFWFHTCFISKNHLILPRDEVDGVRKAKAGIFSEKFAVELFFAPSGESFSSSLDVFRSTKPTFPTSTTSTSPSITSTTTTTTTTSPVKVRS